MDFTPTPGQVDAAGLAAQLFGDRCTAARLTEVERAGDRFDRELWEEVGRAGLLGIPLPENHGGAGLGLLELVSVLEEAGRKVAPLPLAGHTVAAMTLAAHGGEQLRGSWLPAAGDGSTLLVAAVAEDAAAFPEHPATIATPAGDGWTLTGAKTALPAGPDAAAFLVVAATPDGAAVFLVRPDDAGVSVVPQQLTGGERGARLELDGATLPADRRLGDGAATFLAQQLSVALAALQLGTCDGALALTAAYARTREQFGRPIGSFQAVAQRLADCYIDVQGLRLVVTSAAWRLAEGLPADVEVACARLWAADTGHKVAHTAVHVHGGVGIDLDGEAHRYFTSAKRTELLLGGTTVQARTLGRLLAAEPA